MAKVLKRELQKELVERLKQRVDNEEEFKAVYTKIRDGSAYASEFIGDDLLLDIQNMFLWYLDTIGDTLCKHHDISGYIWGYVNASYDNSCGYVLVYEDHVLLTSSVKPWNFEFDGMVNLKKAIAEDYLRAEKKLVLVLEK